MNGQTTVEALLSQRIGLDPTVVGAALLARAVGRRMKAGGLADADAYLDRLLRDADELDELVEEVVVPESWFLRDRRPFDLLGRHAAGWLGDPGRPPLRALSLPCARGEEPYSIAITLLDAGLSPDRFGIDAVDVSARSLERARRGVFGPGSFRGADLAFRDRYFRPHPEGFELDRRVRETVRFVRGNLIDPDLLRDQPPYDVVFCRNLLIYLDVDARTLAIDGFDRRLVGSGLLFVGHAETLAHLAPRFVPTEDRGSFAYRRAAAAALALPSKPAHPRRPRLGPAKVPARPAAPVEPLTRVPVATPTGPAAPELLEIAATLANRRLFDQAARLCEQHIRRSGPSARAYHLLGTIHQAAGDEARAEACFQKAVYLDGQHDEALLALSLLSRRRGDSDAADRYRQRAERAHARKGES